MNRIYIGDRPLDPPEDDECETCGGSGEVFVGGYQYFGEWQPPEPNMDSCPDCGGSGSIEASDPAEPNPYPED